MGKYRSYSAEFKVQVVLEARKRAENGSTNLSRTQHRPGSAHPLEAEFPGASPATVPDQAATVGRARADRRPGTPGGTTNDGVSGLKKSLQAAALPLRQRREIIAGLAREFPVRLLCRVVEVAPSSFYYQGQLIEEVELRAAIEQIALEFPRYGYRRMTAELHRQGWPVNHKHVLRIMREESLLVQVRRYCQTTNSRHSYGVYPNLLTGLEIVRPNQVWAADLTYSSTPRMAMCSCCKRHRCR